MERKIEVGKIYRHFKGHVYKVIAIAYDSENYNEDNPELSKMVVYQNVADKNQCWIRPYQMFNSLVDKEKYPEVVQRYRFDDITKEYKANIKSQKEATNKLSKLSGEGFEMEEDPEIVLQSLDPIWEVDEEFSKIPYVDFIDMTNLANCYKSDFSLSVDEKIKKKERKQ